LTLSEKQPISEWAPSVRVKGLPRSWSMTGAARFKKSLNN